MGAVVFVASFLVLTFLNPRFIRADDGIILSPAIIEKEVHAGDTLSFSIKATNNKTSEKTFYIFASSFSASDDESGQPAFNDKQTSGVPSWFYFPENSITISPGERREIPVEVNVPGDATSGSNYGAIVVSEVNPKVTGKGSTVGVSQESAILVLFSVPGIVETKGNLLGIFPEKYIFWNSPIRLYTRFENLGNVYIKPTGLLEVYNMFDQKEAVIQINNGFNNVLPSTVRKFENIWDPPKYLGFIPRIGRFRVESVVIYNNPTITTKVPPFYFWIIPYKFLIAVIGGFVVFCLVIYSFLQLYKKKAIHSYRQTRER